MITNTRVSEALSEIYNLINIVEHHKRTCDGPDCGVSLWKLGMTAKRLINHCWMHEREHARRIILETNWS